MELVEAMDPVESRNRRFSMGTPCLDPVRCSKGGGDPARSIKFIRSIGFIGFILFILSILSILSIGSILFNGSILSIGSILFILSTLSIGFIPSYCISEAVLTSIREGAFTGRAERRGGPYAAQEGTESRLEREGEPGKNSEGSRVL